MQSVQSYVKYLLGHLSISAYALWIILQRLLWVFITNWYKREKDGEERKTMLV